MAAGEKVKMFLFPFEGYQAVAQMHYSKMRLAVGCWFEIMHLCNKEVLEVNYLKEKCALGILGTYADIYCSLTFVARVI